MGIAATLAGVETGGRRALYGYRTDQGPPPRKTRRGEGG